MNEKFSEIDSTFCKKLVDKQFIDRVYIDTTTFSINALVTLLSVLHCYLIKDSCVGPSSSSITTYHTFHCYLWCFFSLSAPRTVSFYHSLCTGEAHSTWVIHLRSLQHLSFHQVLSYCPSLLFIIWTCTMSPYSRQHSCNIARGGALRSCSDNYSIHILTAYWQHIACS